jgi:hypothetical protein
MIIKSSRSNKLFIAREDVKEVLYTADNYCTGDYVCVECGERVGKVAKNGPTDSAS